MLSQGRVCSYCQTPGQARFWVSTQQLLRHVTAVIRSRRRRMMYLTLASACLLSITLDDGNSVAHSSQNCHKTPQERHQQEKKRTHHTRGLHFENLQRHPTVYLTSPPSHSGLLRAGASCSRLPESGPWNHSQTGTRDHSTEGCIDFGCGCDSIFLAVSGIELHISASKSRRHFSHRSLQLRWEKSLQKALMNYLPT